MPASNPESTKVISLPWSRGACREKDEEEDDEEEEVEAGQKGSQLRGEKGDPCLLSACWEQWLTGKPGQEGSNVIGYTTAFKKLF